MRDYKKYITELIGTFALVFIGCGTAVIAGDDVGFLGISFAFGLTLLGMVYAIGHISGCHINPAVSVSMRINGKINTKDMIMYILFQCIGAIIASTLLFLIAAGQPGYSVVSDGLGQNGYDAASPGNYNLVSAFIAEILMTMVFLLVILGSTSKNAPKGLAGIAIGLTLVLIHIFGIPITGVSVNPARSLGPAVLVAIFGNMTAIIQLWMFWLGPLIGGTLAALIWVFILRED
jgi:aquaporin Z